MINYFYNITSTDEKLNFYTDVFTNIRKEFYLTKEKVKGRITQNSSLDSVYYDFSLAKDKTLKWNVSDDNHILSDCKNLEDGKYCVSFYCRNGLNKQITFSKFHTLLKVEYFDMDKATTPYMVIEPRKSSNGLCLLFNVVGSYQSVILFPMPYIDDDYIADKVENEFHSYCAVASTDEGIVKFLDSKLLEEFEDFVEQAKDKKLVDTAPKSFIDESDAVLADKLNPKDFNLRKNLSTAIDITQADEFSYESEDAFDNAFESKADGFVEMISTEADINVKHEVADDTIEEVIEEPVEEIVTPESDLEIVEEDLCENIFSDEEYESIVSTFVEYTKDGLVSDEALEITEAELNDSVELPEIDESVSETESVEASVEVLEEITDDTLNVQEEIVPQEAPDVIAPLVDQELSEAVDDIIVEDSVVDEENEFYNNISKDDKYIIGEEIVPTRIIENASAKYMYYGDVDSEGNRTGFGRTTTDDGRTAYEGQYSMNKRNGVGAYYYKDGELCYFGNWKDNKRDGFGIGVSSFDKSVHIGSFKDNKPEGDGARVDNRGNVRFVKKTLSNGMTVLLEFDEDKIVITKYNEDGEVISENSSNLRYF